MKYNNTILAALLGLALASSAHATAFSIEVEDSYALYNSTGAPSGDVTFAFGIFAEGFSPTYANAGQWQTFWRTGGDALGAIEGGGAYWSTYFNLADNNVIPAGAQLYAWAYNTPDIEAGTAEWLLLSDPEWLSVVSTAADWTQHDFEFSSHTIAIVGSFDFGAGTAQLANVSGSIIPEPAAYAALFGPGALGFALMRRKRAS